MFSSAFFTNGWFSTSWWSKSGADEAAEVERSPYRTVTILSEIRTVAVLSEVRASFITKENRSVIIMANPRGLRSFSVPLDVLEDIDYLYNWASWLTGENDTISTATVTLPDGAIADGLEVHDVDIVDIKDDEGNITFPRGGVVVWFKVAVGSQDSAKFSPYITYEIPCKVVTTGGRSKNVSAQLVVRKL